jgi:hypothetical protein
MPSDRVLTVYAFDPTQARSFGNVASVHVPFEELKPGPVGRRIEVIDYDATNRCYYAPVDLDDPEILRQGGLPPSESSPQFHQQMAYAVAQQTIGVFQIALGRQIRWAFARRKKTGGELVRLRIHPHGMAEANAYYSRELKALLFGYFPAGDDRLSPNVPGQTIFTCLSHDIVAHETTHALVDGQREHFMEPTSVDSLAFHEAFADIVALFQHFGEKDALLETIRRTGGRIHQAILKPQVAPGPEGVRISDEIACSNPMMELARQFGDALGHRAALRSAIGSPPGSFQLDETFEPHQRGAILVAAVFDAFFTAFTRRTADLFRIARNGVESLPGVEIHPDLAARLSSEAAKTARHFCQMCIRALDYCPPLDVDFGDFLRALVTADADLVPDDRYDYREALVTAFRLRGIRPKRVASLSEESLKWQTSLEGRVIPPCEDLEFTSIGPGAKGAVKAALKANARALHAFGEANAQALGLSPKLPIQPHSFHTVFRVGPNQARYEFVAELLQRRPEPMSGARGAPKFWFRGGCTLVFDEDGRVRYCVSKPIASDHDGHAEERLQNQRAFFDDYGALVSGATYATEPAVPFLPAAGTRHRDPLERHIDFSAVHRGF